MVTDLCIWNQILSEKAGGEGGEDCLFHICVYSVLSLVPKSQTNNTLARWVHSEINSCNMESQPQEESK